MPAKSLDPLRIDHQGEGMWSGKIALPRMAALRSRSRKLVDIEGYGDARVSADQRSAIELLRNNEPAVLDTLLSALAQETGLTTQRVREGIRIESITLPGEARDARAYVEIHGNCDWDPEHGFRVVMHGLRVVDVGTAMSSWSDDPAAPALSSEQLAAMAARSREAREKDLAERAAADPVLRQKMDENERYHQDLKELGPEAATARALERARALVKQNKNRRRA